jgi:hypothetical protein
VLQSDKDWNTTTRGRPRSSGGALARIAGGVIASKLLVFCEATSRYCERYGNPED